MVVRGKQRQRANRGKWLLRSVYAGLLLTFSAQSIGHLDYAANAAVGGAGALLTASIATDGTVAHAVNRNGKTDQIIIRPRAINAGVLQTASLFAPSSEGVAVAFALPAPAVVAAAVGEMIAPRLPARAPVVAAVATGTEQITPTEVALLSYAPDDGDKNAPFDAVLGGRSGKSVVLDASIDATHAWVNDTLPASVRSAAEVKCLANAIYFEARSEPESGQIAVAQVVLNRVKNPAYPDTICSVVYQNKNKRNRCQFSFACDGIRDRITEPRAWEEAQRLARRVLNDDRTLYLASVGAATHYHATYVKPRWARSMTKMQKIGQHIFYKTKNGGWS